MIYELDAILYKFIPPCFIWRNEHDKINLGCTEELVYEKKILNQKSLPIYFKEIFVIRKVTPKKIVRIPLKHDLRL